MNENSAYVYILASKRGTLYTGVTNNIERRVLEHKQDINEGFTKKYRCHKLVYFEEIGDIGEAILREKQIKGWSRAKKTNLIRSLNPPWEDLAKDWYGDLDA